MWLNQYDNNDMKEFLMKKANFEERNNDPCSNGWFCEYNETITEKSYETDNYEYCTEYNLERIRDNEYHSYVHRIGVLYMWDANKCDYAEFHIAFQNKKDGEIIYLGMLDFNDGENMDLLTTAQRIAFSMIKCLI